MAFLGKAVGKKVATSIIETSFLGFRILSKQGTLISFGMSVCLSAARSLDCWVD